MTLGDKLNKKRNTGLVYKVLIQEITKALLDKNKVRAQNIFSIVKKNFAPNTLLAEELQLYSLVENTKANNREMASRILQQVLSHAQNMDVKKLEEAKSALIKEINYYFGKDSKVLNNKIKHYRIFSSLHGLINNVRKKQTLLESVEKIKLEETIVDFMNTNDKNEEKLDLNKFKLNETYNGLAYRLIVQKFNQKYGEELNDRQKKLVENYIQSYLLKENLEEFKKYILKEALFIRKVIDSSFYREPTLHNKPLQEKLSQAKEKLNELIMFKNPWVFGQNQVDVDVNKMLEFQDLAEELLDMTPEEKARGII